MDERPLGHGPDDRMITFLAPLASFLLPGSGQLLQGRFALGVKHASLAMLLIAIGVPMSTWSLGLFSALLGGWSAYDAWRYGRVPAAMAEVPERDVADAAASARVRSSSPLVPLTSWHRGVGMALLLALQAVAAVEIAVLFMAAAVSGMVFDAPGSMERLELWAFVIGMTVAPLVAAVLCFVAWGLHGRGKTWWAVATLASVVVAGLALLRLMLGPGPLW